MTTVLETWIRFLKGLPMPAQVAAYAEVLGQPGAAFAWTTPGRVTVGVLVSEYTQEQQRALGLALESLGIPVDFELGRRFKFGVVDPGSARFSPSFSIGTTLELWLMTVLQGRDDALRSFMDAEGFAWPDGAADIDLAGLRLDAEEPKVWLCSDAGLWLVGTEQTDFFPTANASPEWLQDTDVDSWGDPATIAWLGAR